MYCNRVLRVIDELGINVEVRNIWDARDNEKELFENTGQRSVPVLRITSGEDEIWMPESSDIIRYLESQVADKPEN